jgi:hypothetical protein
MSVTEAIAERVKSDRAAKIEKNSPRQYDLTDPAELQRLFREVRGYLHTCHKKHGTDWEGRRFAIEALDALTERKV